MSSQSPPRGFFNAISLPGAEFDSTIIVAVRSTVQQQARMAFTL
jgi:hypothetical protein